MPWTSRCVRAKCEPGSWTGWRRSWTLCVACPRPSTSFCLSAHARRPMSAALALDFARTSVCARALRRFNSGQQWDMPNGWAPLQYFIVESLLQLNLTEGAGPPPFRPRSPPPFRARARIPSVPGARLPSVPGPDSLPSPGPPPFRRRGPHPFRPRARLPSVPGPHSLPSSGPTPFRPRGPLPSVPGPASLPSPGPTPFPGPLRAART